MHIFYCSVSPPNIIWLLFTYALYSHLLTLLCISSVTFKFAICFIKLITVKGGKWLCIGKKREVLIWPESCSSTEGKHFDPVEASINRTTREQIFDLLPPVPCCQVYSRGSGDFLIFDFFGAAREVLLGGGAARERGNWQKNTFFNSQKPLLNQRTFHQGRATIKYITT